MLIAAGGVAVPVLGWLVGIVLLWTSPVWKRWEMIAATLAPIVTAGLTCAVISVIAQQQAGPVAAEVSVVLANAVVAIALANFVVGLVLVVVAIRRVGSTSAPADALPRMAPRE